ncbi:MAG: hypothetical protein OXE57_10380 [Alphaproteobacteria bacterium]|nr:hypothetical protein [Alphaproteobacteria bacterium]
MTAADFTPWISPAVLVVLFAWLRMDLGKRIDEVNSRLDRVDRRIDGVDQRLQGIDDRLRAVEVTVGRMSGKLDLLEGYFLRRNDPDGDPPLAPAAE